MKLKMLILSIGLPLTTSLYACNSSNGPSTLSLIGEHAPEAASSLIPNSSRPDSSGKIFDNVCFRTGYMPDSFGFGGRCVYECYNWNGANYSTYTRFLYVDYVPNWCPGSL